MTDQELRLSQLQQIPKFALSGKLKEFAQDDAYAKKLADRFQNVLGVTPRKLKNSIANCTHAQLVKLIQACPEIDANEITRIFREYRYSTSPALHLFKLDAIDFTSFEELEVLKSKMEQLFEGFNDSNDGRPVVKRLELIELLAMQDQTGIIESNFRYLKRLDYVDCNEEPVSTYETIYGFFWINCSDGYVVIHASARQIRTHLVLAIERAIDTKLRSLRLPKELQKILPFLGEDSMTFGRLYNHDPESPNFTSIAVKDEKLQAKGYKQIEDAYSNVRQANYKDLIGENGKKTTIVVNEIGSFRVYGKHSAGQYRAWCLERLRHIVSTVKQYQMEMDNFISNLDLPEIPRIDDLDSYCRQHILRIISVLAAFKKFPGISQYPLGVSALQVAEHFGSLVYVRIPVSCQHEYCLEDACLTCPICESRRLTVHRATNWIISCPNHFETRLQQPLPVRFECDQSHENMLSQAAIETTIEVFYSRRLLSVIAEVCNKIVPDRKTDFGKEMIHLSGENVVYLPKKTKILSDAGDTYNVVVNNSKSTAVGPGASATVTK